MPQFRTNKKCFTRTEYRVLNGQLCAVEVHKARKARDSYERVLGPVAKPVVLSKPQSVPSLLGKALGLV